jgi:1-acyl-sn-glycerol-3-phosphate acyltransferase
MTFSLIRQTITYFRLARFVLHLIYGLLLAIPFPALGAQTQRYILRLWSRQLLEVMNVKITQAPKFNEISAGMVVANHISWIDVCVLNTIVPTRFVAKAELRAWPIIGWLCSRAQTLFIERGKARAAARINLEVVEQIKEGFQFSVFPEGTTTDGSYVAAFHSSLLQPAVDAGVMVQPLALTYFDADGERSVVAPYVGEMTFVASLWLMLSAPSLQVQVLATAELNAAEMDRRQLAQAAKLQIEAALSRVVATEDVEAFIDSSYSLNSCATSGS